MSLINQVLRDLDKRHAAGPAMPAAVKAPAPGPVSAGRGRVLAVGVLAVAAVASTAGVVASRTSASLAAAGGTAVVAVPASAPIATPVVVLAARDDRPTMVVAMVHAADSPASASAQVARHPQAAVAMNLVADDSTEARRSSTQATRPMTVTQPLLPDARIDKRPPARTPRERAEAAYQRGVAAHQRGELVEAATAYAAALREEKGFAQAREAWAGLLIGDARIDEAKALLTEGVALAPEQPGLAMMLARLHAERGELQRAADILQTASATSASAEDSAFHAAILQRLNRHAEAAEHFGAALRLAPANGVWWMGLGMSLAAEGRTDTAREAFNRARASGSLSPELASYVDQRLRQLL